MLESDSPQELSRNEAFLSDLCSLLGEPFDLFLFRKRLGRKLSEQELTKYQEQQRLLLKDLKMLIGGKRERMLCLVCATENSVFQEVSRCRKCGFQFDQFPPFPHANHISQLQQILDAYLDGSEVTLALQRALKNFSHELEKFRSRWQPWEDQPFKERFLETLNSETNAGWHKIDMGILSLEDVWEIVVRSQEKEILPEQEELEKLHQSLGDFYNLVYQGLELLKIEE